MGVREGLFEQGKTERSEPQEVGGGEIEDMVQTKGQ